MSTTSIIIDGGPLQSLYRVGGVAAWDLLLSRGGGLIVLETVLQEVPKDVIDAFHEWADYGDITPIHQFSPAQVRHGPNIPHRRP